MIGAAGVADRQRGHLEVVERLHPRLEYRRRSFVALQVNTANCAGAVVQVEVAGEFRVRWLRLEGLTIGELLIDVGPRTQQPLLLASPQAESNGSPQPEAGRLQD